MKKLLFVLLITAALPTITSAQDKLTDIKKLFRLMNTEKMMDDIMDGMMETLTNRVSNGLKEKTLRKNLKHM
jgi:hypothetical protein